MTNELKQPTSRRFQYSLPSLMLFVLVCSLVFAGVGAFYRRMERERQAITEIVKAEGVCDVSHSPLGSILMLDVSGTQVTDLSPLTELRSLVWLEVDGTQVSDLAPPGRVDEPPWAFARRHAGERPNAPGQVEESPRALPRRHAGER